MKHFKVMTRGEIGLPAEFADRWRTHSVSVEDHDGYIVIRPVPHELPVPDDEWPAEETPAAARRGQSGAGY